MHSTIHKSEQFDYLIKTGTPAAYSYFFENYAHTFHEIDVIHYQETYNLEDSGYTRAQVKLYFPLKMRSKEAIKN